MSKNHQKIIIPDNELIFKFIHSSGPGGQNVNKVATAVQLRFDVKGSTSLPEKIKERLFVIAKNKINENGILVLESSEHRSQYQNRKSVTDKLHELIRQAAVVRKTRIKTKPSAASQKKRLDQKRRRGLLKKTREKVTLKKES